MAPCILRHPRTHENSLEEYLLLARESPHASEVAEERFLVLVEETLEEFASMPVVARVVRFGCCRRLTRVRGQGL